MKILQATRLLVASFHHRIWMVVFFSVVLMVLLIHVNFLVKIIFDQAIPQRDIGLLLKLTLAAAVLMAANGLLSVYARTVTLRYTKRRVFEIRDALSRKLLHRSHMSYQRADLSRMHKVLVYDTEKLDNFANAVFSIVIPAACVSMCLFIVLLTLSLQMSLLLLAITPFIIAVTAWLRRSGKKSLIRFQQMFEKFHKQSLFILQSNKLIKVSATQQAEGESHTDIVAALEESSLKMAIGYTRMSQYQEVIFSLGSIALLAWGSYQVMNRAMTFGTLMSFYFCLFLLRKYLTAIGNVLPSIVEGADSLQYCTALLTEGDEEIYTGTYRNTFTGNVEFRNVSFAFGDRMLFKDFSLLIKPGETTLVRGPNGSGKSTLVNLMLGLYRPHAGALYADSHPYAAWDIQYLRRNMAVVLQEDTMFQGSILDNITYGNPGVASEVLMDAVREAGLYELIASLPEGLQTDIGEKGTTLSGGQRQKIAIARCLLLKASLIILDEPTNHLDQDSVLHIVKVLKTQPHKPGILVISHDATLPLHADQIVDLKSVSTL